MWIWEYSVGKYICTCSCMRFLVVVSWFGCPIDFARSLSFYLYLHFCCSGPGFLFSLPQLRVPGQLALSSRPSFFARRRLTVLQQPMPHSLIESSKSARVGTSRATSRDLGFTCNSGPCREPLSSSQISISSPTTTTSLPSH